MQSLAEEYLRTMSLVTSSCKNFQRQPDSSNPHRVLGLYTQLALLFANAFFFFHLNMEANHHILKLALSKRTRLRGRIESMKDAYCNYCTQLVYETWIIYNKGIYGDTEEVPFSLRFLLFSETLLFVDIFSNKN